MPTSEKQKLANQRNAQKSTGPKTEAGKATCRANALKHGLTGAGVVQPKSAKKQIAERVAQWRERLAPIDPVEHCLVARAALASVRVERCVRQELADLKRRKRRAQTRWEKKQEAALNLSVEKLNTNPAEATRELHTTTRGCQWLILHWQRLSEALHALGGWDRDQADHAQRLLGLDPKAPYPCDEAIAALRQQMQAVLDDTGLDDVPPPVPYEEAYQSLRDLAAAQVERLTARAKQLWQTQDGPDRQDAEDRVLIDTSDHGARLLRYEATNDLMLHRNLNQLIHIRKIEPDTATIQRFHKLGKKVSRVWNCVDWSPWPGEEDQYAGTDDPPADEECPPPPPWSAAAATPPPGPSFAVPATPAEAPAQGPAAAESAPATQAGSSPDPENRPILAPSSHEAASASVNVPAGSPSVPGTACGYAPPPGFVVIGHDAAGRLRCLPEAEWLAQQQEQAREAKA